MENNITPDTVTIRTYYVKSAIKQKIDPGYLSLILFYLGQAINSIIASYSFYQTLKAN